jgi:murein DD-endopeptidase MepM/ murein hydrolase activator NlpD
MRTLWLFIMMVSLSEAKSLGSVAGVALELPLALSVEDFIARSIGHIPQAIIQDGLPFFGSKRGDFKRKPRLHKGLDIYVNHVDILASAQGRVIEIAHGKLSGTYIKLQHEKGVQTLYIHLTSVAVKKGADVKQGEVLGRIDGAAGNAIAPQLHYEIKLKGVHQDPLKVLKKAYHDKRLLAQIAKDEMMMQEVITKRDYLVKEYLKTH